jgi:hypothetical protein
MIISESGGIIYHIKALKHHDSVWKPYKKRLESWLLETWNPPSDQPLILIGPSAGWCLTQKFLDRFENVTAYDIDPLALFLLKKRFKHAIIRTCRQDALDIHANPAAEALRVILRETPQNPSILFCNLWGQVFLDEKSESMLPRWRRELESILNGKNWASFYDRVSGEVSPHVTIGNEHSSKSLTNQELIDRFYGSPNEPRATTELLDHSTGGFFTDLPRLHLHWELQPGRHHLIEAIHSASN